MVLRAVCAYGRDSFERSALRAAIRPLGGVLQSHRNQCRCIYFISLSLSSFLSAELSFPLVTPSQHIRCSVLSGSAICFVPFVRSDS